PSLTFPLRLNVSTGTQNPLAHAEEFSRRQKHRKGWVYAAGFGLFAAIVAAALWGIFSSDWKARLLWFVPAAIGLFLLKRLLLASKGSPQCPSCRQDITNCGAGFCHACGQAIQTVPCQRCGADPNWTAGFQSVGLRQPIRHCPGCGAYLNTDFYRHELDPD